MLIGRVIQSRLLLQLQYTDTANAFLKDILLTKLQIFCFKPELCISLQLLDEFSPNNALPINNLEARTRSEKIKKLLFCSV